MNNKYVVIDTKPKNWKQVGYLMYSNRVSVYNKEFKYITSINVTYKIDKNRNIDDIWTKEYLENTYGSSFHIISHFKRDGSLFPFIESIFVDEITFKTKVLNKKLKRLIDE